MADRYYLTLANVSANSVEVPKRVAKFASKFCKSARYVEVTAKIEGFDHYFLVEDGVAKEIAGYSEVKL